MFDFNKSLSQEECVRPLFTKTMPYLKFTDGRGHDCYYGTEAIELKVELGYFLKNEPVTDLELVKQMKEIHNLDIRTTSNVFLELLSDTDKGTLGGVLQSYFKDKNKRFCIAHVFPYNNLMVLINGRKLIEYVLKDKLLAHKGNVKKIKNTRWYSTGVPIGVSEIISETSARKFPLDCGEEKFKEHLEYVNTLETFNNDIKKEKVVSYLKNNF